MNKEQVFDNVSDEEVETQFSIYKIDLPAVRTTLKTAEKDPSKLVDQLCTYVRNIAQKRNKEKNYAEICQSNQFKSVFIVSVHYPKWKNLFINQFNIDQSKTQNSNVSFVMFYVSEQTIFAMTGGYGSSYIRGFVVKNFGLYLIPKIIGEDQAIIKRVNELNLTSNRVATQRMNRKTTSASTEQDLSSIYKDLNVEIDQTIASQLGIIFKSEERADKRVNLVNKDSLVIKRSFTLSQLKKVIDKLVQLEKKKDKFVLNYLVTVNKLGIKEKDLTKKLIQILKENDPIKIDGYQIVGDEFDKYYLNATKYFLIDAEANIVIEQESPIVMEDLFKVIQEKKSRVTISLWQDILKKWKIYTEDHSGDQMMFPTRVFEVFTAFMEYGDDGKIYYLINGSWYSFVDQYCDILDKEFNKVFDKSIQIAENIKNQF